MIAVGNNAVVFCPLALMKIVEQHLNAQQVSGPDLRVTAVQESDGGFKFAVTSDQAAK